MKERKKLGEILIEAKILTEEQLNQALEIQKQTNKRLGDILIENNFIKESHLLHALSKQLSIPWVSLWHVDIDEELLSKVPQNIAEEYCLIPVYIRKVKGEKTLYVAMDDPTNEEALRFVRAFSGMPVKPMLASQREIREAIKEYYKTSEDTLTELLGRKAELKPKETYPLSKSPPLPYKDKPPEGLEEVENKTSYSEPREEETKLPPSKEIDIFDESTIEVSTPTERKDKRTRIFSFTLLDGTTISISRSSGEDKLVEREEHSVEGLITSLLSEAPKSKGITVEKVVAALLEILYKKYLITDNELKEALDKFKNI